MIHMLDTVKLAYKMYKDNTKITKDIYEIENLNEGGIAEDLFPDWLMLNLKMRQDEIKFQVLLIYGAGIMIGASLVTALSKFGTAKGFFAFSIVGILIWASTISFKEVKKSKKKEASIFFEIQKYLRVSISDLEKLFKVPARTDFSPEEYFSKLTDAELAIFEEMLEGRNPQKKEVIEALIKKSIDSMEESTKEKQTQINELLKRS